MPGVTAIAGNTDDDVVGPALEAVRFLDRYERTDHVSTDSTLVAHTRYEEYPIRSFEADGLRLLLEGHLYGADDVAAAIEPVAAALVDGDVEAASDWVASRDGEFVLVAVDPDGGRLWVVNDQFGRLPIYYATIDGTHLVSRELGFVREFARRTTGELDVDPLAAGQVMLLGYPLGTRSLFGGVDLLPPSGLLRVDGEVAAESLHRFDLSGYAHADRGLEENASTLRSLFVEACANRADAGETNVVSLSGGMDSRAVLVGYDATDGASLAATSVPPTGESEDGRVAERVATRFDVEWKEYVAQSSDRHRADLLRMAKGMNGLGTAVGLDFCESVVEDYPDAALVTGDGGDEVLPDLTPPGPTTRSTN